MATTPSSLQIVKEVEASVVGDQAPTPAAGSLEIFANQNDIFYKKTSAGVSTPLVAGAASVSNADGTLTISPTTGAVVASRPAITGDISVPVASNVAAIAAGVIVNADINASAAIDATKIADGSVTSAEFQFINTLSSNAQTQIDGKVPTARTITATSPVQIDGTTSADLSANRTLSVIPSSATLPGSMSAAGFKKQRDQYTDWVNDLGCDPTGSVDGTSLVQAWVNGLTTSGLGFIPAQSRVRVDGPITCTKEFRVVGAERRTSIISTGSATLTQFDVTADSVVFENLRFEAGATAQNLSLRSAGFCVDIDATSNGSGLYRCDIIGHWSGVNIEGQLGFVDDCSIREYGALAGSGACIRVNAPSAGGDTYIRRVVTDNGSNISGWAGVRVINCASLVMEACNIIHATNGLALEPPAAGTVPSIEATNCFFDTCTNGLNINPNATGFVYRSKFTNCWFGSNTGAGVLMNNPGGATSSFDGLTFDCCDFYGNGTGISTPTGGGKWQVADSRIAGNTVAGISLVASAGHYPKIFGNTIAPTGAFGVNLVGITVGAGTYKGLEISNNSVVNNTTNFTLGAVTVAAGEGGWFRIIDNAGINPRGTELRPIAIPVAGTTYTNTSGFRVQVMHKNSVAPTAVTINGLLYTVAFLAAQVFTVTLEPGGTISFTAGTHTSWTWVGQ